MFLISISTLIVFRSASSQRQDRGERRDDDQADQSNQERRQERKSGGQADDGTDRRRDSSPNSGTRGHDRHRRTQHGYLESFRHRNPNPAEPRQDYESDGLQAESQEHMRNDQQHRRPSSTCGCKLIEHANPATRNDVAQLSAILPNIGWPSNFGRVPALSLFDALFDRVSKTGLRRSLRQFERHLVSRSSPPSGWLFYRKLIFSEMLIRWKLTSPSNSSRFEYGGVSFAIRVRSPSRAIVISWSPQ